MTLALLIIWSFEHAAIMALLNKYGAENTLEFHHLASLDDIIRLRFHAINAWICLGFLTIVRSL